MPPPTNTAPPFALVADLQARMTTPIADQAHATTLLEDVSNAVRVIARQQITAGTDTARVVVDPGRVVTVPQRKLSRVVSVTDIATQPVAEKGWVGQQVHVAAPAGTTLIITYEHEYPPHVLANLRSFVATIAARVHGVGGAQAGAIIAESIGSYSYQMGGSGSATGGWSFTKGERKTIRQMLGLPAAGTIWTEVGP